jgi:hypothetical protein
MFKVWRKRITQRGAAQSVQRAISIGLEPLENRCLMSASSFDGFGGGPGGHRPGGGGGHPGAGPGGQTIAFSLAPTVVQTGLDALATADNLTDPTSTQLVSLNNVNGVETYSVTIDGTGSVTRLTVDSLGDAVTAPTLTTTTWATLSGTGTGSDAAAASEITAIATALNLTAPASTDTVNVSTAATGAVTYSIQLASSTSSTTTTSSGDAHFDHIMMTPISVDGSGNPVGNQQLPFSVFSAAIQAGLNSGAPTGATALASTSTQLVGVATVDDVVTYSTTFTASGTQTKVTVNSAGAAVSLPTTTTTTFSALSSALQTEIQTLATADGVTTTIATTQTVNVLTETNGTVLYSVTLSATGTDPAGSSFTFDVTVTIDANGNPTVLPPGGGNLNNGGSGGGGDCGPGNSGSSSNSSGGSSSNSSSGSTSNASGGSSLSVPSSGGVTTSSTTSAAGTYALTAKVLSAATNGLGMLGGYFVEFAPATVDAAVKTDLTSIQTAQKQLATDTQALTAAEKSTLRTETKAVNAAIKAISATLAPLQKTLKTDTATWAKTLAVDAKAIAKDRKNPTALAAAKSHLATDRSAAFAAITADQSAIQTAIDSNSGVITAQAKLAADLPTIAADQSAIRTDQAQLVTDIEAELSAI